MAFTVIVILSGQSGSFDKRAICHDWQSRSKHDPVCWKLHQLVKTEFKLLYKVGERERGREGERERGREGERERGREGEREREGEHEPVCWEFH